MILVVGGVFVFSRWVMPPTAPVFDDPSALEALIDSRLAVGVIRLVGLAVAVYVVVSVIALMRGGRWIVKMGSADTDVVEGDREDLQSRLEAAEKETQQLRSILQQALPLIEQMTLTVGGGQGDRERPQASGAEDRG